MPNQHATRCDVFNIITTAEGGSVWGICTDIQSIYKEVNDDFSSALMSSAADIEDDIRAQSDVFTKKEPPKVNGKDEIFSRSIANETGDDVTEKEADSTNKRSLQKWRIIMARDSNVNGNWRIGTKNGNDSAIEAACTICNRKGKRSAMQIMKIKAEEFGSFKESNAALEVELERMRDSVNANIWLIKKLESNALLTESINKTMTMEVQEQRKILWN